MVLLPPTICQTGPDRELSASLNLADEHAFPQTAVPVAANARPSSEASAPSRATPRRHCR